MADLVLGFTANVSQATASISALSRAVLQFAQESVKAFAEQQRADAKLSGALRQLGLDAKALTPVFKAQAEALESTLGVQGEMVQQMQALMLTFGVAPKDIEKTTKAILDYAALTGDDAVSATRLLLREVEAGDGNIRRLGISYDSTGSKTKDLALATDDLSRKMGGAAAEQANTLAGQMARVDNQMDEVKKSFGAFLVMVADKTGVLEGLASAATRARIALAGSSGAEDTKFQIKQLEGLASASESAAAAARKARSEQSGNSLIDFFLYGNLNSEQTAEQFEQRATELRAKANELREQLKKEDEASAAALAGAGSPLGGDDETDAGKKAREKAAKEAAETRADDAKLAEDALADFMRYAGQREEIERAHLESLADIRAAGQEDLSRLSNKELRDRLELQDDLRKVTTAGAEHQNKLIVKQGEGRQSVIEYTQDQDAKTLAKQDQVWADAGAQVGGIFAATLADSLTTGREIELEFLAAQIALALTQAAMMANPATAPFAPVVGIIGNAAIMAAKGAKHTSSMASKMKHHDGGIVEPLQFHGGGEVPAILQTGEVVWSRADVSRFGGAANVDQMRHGGGQTLNVSVQAVDAQSFRDYMTDRGGRGFVQAVKTGRGMMPALMRRR